MLKMLMKMKKKSSSGVIPGCGEGPGVGMVEFMVGVWLGG